MKRYSTLILFLLGIACKKDFLNESPSSNFIKPDDLVKLSGLLKDEELMGATPVIGEISSADYYLEQPDYEKSFPVERNLYIWKPAIFETEDNCADWNTAYQQINTCNVVLNNLVDVVPDITTQELWNITKGTALFVRAYAFFNLAELFAPPYDKDKADKELGIVLKFSSDINDIPNRSSVRATYEQITGDVKYAANLLPPEIAPNTWNHPTKAAAFALLARVYLSMRDYLQALEFSDSCLKYHNTLIDFNKLNFADKAPIGAKNDETLYQSWMNSTNSIIRGKVKPGTIIDSTLYLSYDAKDLRKQLFFATNSSGKPYFKHSYSAKTALFSGLATDEVYLIKAECNARAGQVQKAMADINHLLEHRYVTDTLKPYSASTVPEALGIVLRERRKELLFRGLRWSDLRRLNMEEAQIKLTRVVSNNSFELLPKSNKYVLPIPPNALRGTSIVQNVRH